MASTSTQFKNKKTGVIWDIPEGSVAFKRCKRLKLEYEEIKPNKERKE